MSSKGGGSGQVLGHRREVGRVVLGEEALEELRHLLLEAVDPALDLLDLALDHRGVLLDLGLEPALARRDLRLGLLADPGDLGLRPLADRGDVVVGLAAEALASVEERSWIFSTWALASAWNWLSVRSGRPRRPSAWPW